MDSSAFTAIGDESFLAEVDEVLKRIDAGSPLPGLVDGQANDENFGDDFLLTTATYGYHSEIGQRSAIDQDCEEKK
ncbi:unnamed protein product [Phytophthora fragariaefolia]|uniref:Unnamed protein product n=1 Tax=Phytophthora fragariaefolia TaxID=1490495 RepID=A0A9W6XJ04_9STRA|nr:unnamed protein product [Phytophthora fragariaefolia]